jgi:hypothetical protein
VDERSKETSSFLDRVVEITVSMFDDYIQHPTAVSIKLLVPRAGEPSIHVYKRDQRSAFVRRKLGSPEREYPLAAHSPFLSIVSGDSPNGVFVSNDLKGDPNYRNGSSGWESLYNATLIVAIKEPDSPSSENILGFLCIDSLLGRFDGRACVDLARIVANSIFLSVIELSAYADARLESVRRDAEVSRNHG